MLEKARSAAKGENESLGLPLVIGERNGYKGMKKETSVTKVHTHIRVYLFIIYLFQIYFRFIMLSK